MSYELIMACLCFVGAGVGIYIIWWLANSDDRRNF
jgi:phage shock protein PspC (stress-responsive transcriptional regulator)